jgi:hypothetical protein
MCEYMSFIHSFSHTLSFSSILYIVQSTVPPTAPRVPAALPIAVPTVSDIPVVSAVSALPAAAVSSAVTALPAQALKDVQAVAAKLSRVVSRASHAGESVADGKLNDRLKELKLKVIEGGLPYPLCQFASLMVALTRGLIHPGSTDLSKEVVHLLGEISSWLDHPERRPIVSALLTQGTVHEYLQRLRRGEEEGDHHTLWAFAEIYRVNIRVLTDGEPAEILVQTSSPPANVRTITLHFSHAIRHYRPCIGMISKHLQ